MRSSRFFRLFGQSLAVLAAIHSLGEAAEEAVSEPAAAEYSQTDLWKAGSGGYHTYRIPALVKTERGTLLAFCEGRKKGRGDSGDIDLLLRRSTDDGRTWSAQQVVWDGGTDTCGNPCPVVDRASGAISLLATRNRGADTEKKIAAQTGKGTRTVWILRSVDEGRSWSEPREITAAVKKDDWTWYATGPGAGIQIEFGPHQGRMIVPCDHIEAKTNLYYSHAIFSDDGGRTWRLGGSTPNHRVNECEAVELARPAGRLMLNMRNYDRAEHTRQTAVSDDGGASWKDQKHDPALIEPICQASIRRIRWPQNDAPGVVLFSNPASRDRRERMTLRLSYDDAATWPVEKTIHPDFSAYSCLAKLDGDTVGLLYERDKQGEPYGRITFARFALDWLAKEEKSPR
jgi:sialidase-1